MRTFGAPSGACGPGMKLQSAADWSIVRPIAPPNLRSGIGSTVRSGLNLPAASARASLRPSSIVATDLAGESAMACWAARRSSSRTMARMAAMPGLSFSPRPLSIPLSSLCLANLPTSAPAAAPTATAANIGGAARPTRTPTPPPQPMPLRPRWSPVSLTMTLPSLSFWTRIMPSVLICLLFASCTSASKFFCAGSIA